MKPHFNHLAAALVAHQLTGLSAQPPAHAKGPFRRFDTTADGEANIELFDGGPSIQCRMTSGQGNANPRSCQSGFTSVTVVDAECPTSIFGNGNGNPNKKCFASSIVEGETGKIYHVNSAGDVSERDSADYPDEEDPPNEGVVDVPQALSNRSLRGGESTTGRSLQGTPVIDVLVVYTQGAKADAQFYADGPIEDLVNLAIAETNEAYVNSGIDAELNLLALHEDTSGYTADVGSTSMSSSLYHLTYKQGSSSDPDGLLDYVHTMRTDIGADMVVLITTGAGCGIAWLGGNCETCFPNAGNQFSVTKYSCATGYFSFGHELGHNMGAHHDKGTVGNCGDTDYRFGYRDPAGQYRSILSYSCATGQCDSNPGGPCTRSQFFSNPDYLWNGKPMGVSSADTRTGETNNAKRIGERAQFISDFYERVVTTTDSPTPPVTPNPTNPPTEPQPTSPPTPAPTNPPTKFPTPPPTNAPVPPTPAPTNPPTKFPTPPPTNAPVPPTPPPTRPPTNPPTPPPTRNCSSITKSKDCVSPCTWTNNRGVKTCA